MAEGLYDFVKAGYDTMEAYADDAFDAALEFLDELARQSALINIPDITYTWGALPDIADISIPDAPIEPEVQADFPSAPSDFVPGTITPPNFDEAPDYDIANADVNLPAAPPPLDVGDAPLAPDTDTDLDYPVAPDYAIPSVPTLEDVTIPLAPAIEFPTFDSTAPVDDLVVPGLTFSYQEDDYASELVDAVVAKLINDITVGGTGLSQAVEQAIWDRGRNREDQASIIAKEETRADSSKRGFTLPPGVLDRSLQDIAQETQGKIIDLSREIMIKQAEMEQQNVQFAVGEAIRLETTQMNLWNDRMARRFAVAQYTQDTAIALFNADVALYKTQLEAYNINAQVFNTLIAAELGKLEVYKAELDGQKLINDINKTTVDIYKTTIDSLVAQSTLYKTEMEAVRLQLDAEKTKIDIYLGEIQGYTAQIEAVKAQYDVYNSQIEGEMAKVRIYEAEVSAYSERMKAYATEIDAVSKVSDIEIEQERLRLSSYTNALEAFKAELDAESTRLSTLVSVYSTQVQAYDTTVGASTKVFDSTVSQFNAALQQNETEANMELKKAEVNVTKIIEENKILIETIKAGGALEAELASASLSAISLSAGMTAAGSESTFHNYDYEV